MTNPRIREKRLHQHAWRCLLVLAILSYGCSKGSPPRIVAGDIRVVLTDRHPFLRDHGRKCVVQQAGRVTAQFKLYGDIGLGVISNLYHGPDGNFILIDIDGTWYTINHRNGLLTGGKWRWEEPTPSEYLGCYEYDGSDTYRFVPALSQPEQGIYGFKDPSASEELNGNRG